MPRFYYLVLLTSISKHALKPSPLPTPPPKKKIFSSGIPNMRYFWWWFSSFSTPPPNTHKKGRWALAWTELANSRKNPNPHFFFWKFWFFIPTPYLSPTNRPMRDKTTSYICRRKKKKNLYKMTARLRGTLFACPGTNPQKECLFRYTKLFG